MLEIRYNKNTKALTGWWGSRFGNHKVKLKNRPNEAIIEIDIPIPDKPLGAWLYDKATKSLSPNPDYVEPKPPRNLAVEIVKAIGEAQSLEDLKTKIEKLENK